MKKLTNDIELVKEAIKESAYLQMDDSLTKMRLNVKRCIVILREVPESTSVEVRESLHLHSRLFTFLIIITFNL